MLGHEAQLDPAAAALVGFEHLVDDSVGVGLARLEDEGHILGVGFLRYVVEAYLLDVERVADRLDARQSAVELGEHRVDGAGRKHRLRGEVVARVSDEDVGVMRAAQLQILTDAGAADEAEALRASGLGLSLDLRRHELVLKVGEAGVLVSRYHNVDVVGVDYAEADRRGTQLRLAEHHVVQKVRQREAVEPRRDAELEAGEQHIHWVGVEVRRALDDALDYLGVRAARQDAELLPVRVTRRVGHFFDKLHLFVGGLVKVREHHISDGERLFVLVAARHAEEFAEMLESVLALYLALRERGVLKVQRRVLDDVDVAAGARGDRAQEVARDDDVRRSAADSLRRLRRHAARPVRAETAADALKAEAALHRLARDPVMRSLVRQSADKILKRLVRAFAGVATETLIHNFSSHT